MSNSQTPLQLHISMMKSELSHMEETHINFGLLLKLIREANNLILYEQLEIMEAYHAGRMQKFTDQKLSSLDYYNEKFKTETETTIPRHHKHYISDTASHSNDTDHNQRG